MDTLLQVLTEEPMPPSRLLPKVPRDLETICLKCLAKEPAKRYASAQELADDLRRFREGRPILARPIGSLERLAKWARRRPAAALLVGVSIAATIALLATGLIYQSNLEDALIAANNAKLDAEREEKAAKSNERLAKASERLARRSQFAAEMNLASQAWRDGETSRVINLLFAHHFPPPRRDHPFDFRGFEYFYLWRLCHHADLVLDHPSDITGVAYAPDGKRLYSAGESGTIRVWDTATGKAQCALDADLTGGVSCLALSPDGTRLAAGCGKGLVRVWDCATFQETNRFTLEEEVRSLAFSSSSRLLAVGGTRGVLRIANLSGNDWGARLKGHAGPVISIAFHPTLFALVSCGAEGTVHLWDLDAKDGRVQFREKNGHCYNLAVSPDGQTMAVTSNDGVRVYDWGADQVRLTLGPGILSFGVAFSPDGRHLASTGIGPVRVWSLPDGKPLSTFRGFTNLVRNVAFSKDGQFVAAGETGQIKAWRVGSDPERTIIDAPVGDFAGSPSWHGPRVAVVGKKGGLQVLDRDKREPARILVGPSENIGAVVFSPDGRRLAAGMADGSIRLFEVDSGKLLQSLPASKEKVAGLAITPDGKVLAAAAGKEITLWRLADGVKLNALPTVPMHGLRWRLRRTAGAWPPPASRPLRSGTWPAGSWSSPAPMSAPLPAWPSPPTAEQWPAARITMPAAASSSGMRPMASCSAPCGDTRARSVRWPSRRMAIPWPREEVRFRRTVPCMKARCDSGTRSSARSAPPRLGANHMVTQLWFAADGKSLTATDIRGRSVIWQAADPAEITSLHPYDRLMQPTVEDFQRYGIPLKKP